MSQTTDETPEWMLRLENKKKKPHRLAHEIGAGSPCLSCGDGCPGLDLHFWRKLCRNCKCKKEAHDVKDDEGYEKFEILLGTGNRKRKLGGVLKLEVHEDVKASQETLSAKGVPFDWVPPNVSDDVAAEYMRKLPATKLPISGSDGALYRRQQLEKQVPLHDLDASKCHNLTAAEIEELKKYLDNLKNNVVGQGCVTKIPTLYRKSRLVVLGPHQLHSNSQMISRPLATSQSADSIRNLPRLPPAYNTVPQPFLPPPASSILDDPDDLPPPPPLPDSLPPSAAPKTSSWTLPLLERSVIGSKDVLPEGCMHGLLPMDSGVYASQQAKGIAYSEMVPGSSSPQLSSTWAASGITADKKEAGTGIECPKDLVQGQVHPMGGDEPVGKLPVHETVMSSLLSKDVAHSSSLSAAGPNISVPIVHNHLKDGSYSSIHCPPDIAHFMDLRQGILVSSTSLNKDSSSCGDSLSRTHHPSNIAHSTNIMGQVVPELSAPLAPAGSTLKNGTINSTNVQGQKLPRSQFIPSSKMQYSEVPQETVILPLSVNGVVTASLHPNNIAMSSAVDTDAMPKSAQVMQQSHPPLDPSIIEDLTGHMAEVSAGSQPETTQWLECHECKEPLCVGEVAVFAERAGTDTVWHPQCFVCSTCKELLVDLIYFYNKGNVYCGRDFAELLNIPRCFACDELIFVKEYTVAEGKVFHVKHFCCYECDNPLAGKQYVPVEEQPVCLDCYDAIYGKKCHTCQQKIAASEQRVGWNALSWHVKGNCFRCYTCAKSLLQQRFVVKENQPFCSADCIKAGLQAIA